MTNEQKYISLKNKNLLLEKIIKNPNSSTEEHIEAKRALYKNKIQMLDLIHEKRDSQRTGLTAREYKERARNRKSKPKYSTGIDKLDHYFEGGFETGQIINIAGESYAGKTELVLSVCANMAISKKVNWNNFEMGEKNFLRRLDRILTVDSQWDNFYINEECRDIDELCNEMDLLIEDGYFCFGIDSKMKLSSKSFKDDYQKFSYISKKLSEFAQTRDVIILFINQMNEDDIKNKRLALKGSGDQKYDADITLFLVLEEDKENKKTVEQRQRYLICNKNRQTERTFNVPINHNEYLFSNSDKNPIITEFENVDMPIL